MQKKDEIPNKSDPTNKTNEKDLENEIDDKLPIIIMQCNKDLNEFKRGLSDVVLAMERVLKIEIYDHLRINHGIRQSWEDNWLSTSQNNWEDRWNLVLWKDENSYQKIYKWYDQNKCKLCSELKEKYSDELNQLDEQRLIIIENLQQHEQIKKELLLKKIKQDKILFEIKQREIEKKKRDEEMRRKEAENELNDLLN